MAKFVGRNSKRSVLAIIWDDIMGLDIFTKFFLIVVILVSIVTPIIVNNYQTFTQEASSKATYNITLSNVQNGMANMSVTRSVTNNTVAWVYMYCFNSDGSAVQTAGQLTATPVIWGMWYSLTGTASLPVSGVSCKAVVTVTPWSVKHIDPSITFTL